MFLSNKPGTATEEQYQRAVGIVYTWYKTMSQHQFEGIIDTFEQLENLRQTAEDIAKQDMELKSSQQRYKEAMDKYQQLKHKLKTDDET